MEVYTIDEFNQLKGSVSNCGVSLKAKIDVIIKLPCFNVREAVIVGKPYFTKGRKPHKPPREDPPKPRKQLFTIAPINRIQGILNKMSHTKYESLAMQVADLVPCVSFESFMGCILEQAAKHSFTKEFIYTLRHVYEKYPEMQDNICVYLKKYIQDMQDASLFIWDGDVCGESYDDFCDRVKAKTTTLGKIRTLCELHRVFELEADVSNFIRWYVEYGDSMFSSSDPNPQTLELYLDCMAVMTCSLGGLSQLHGLLQKWKSITSLSKRVQFKLMDLIAALEKIERSATI